MLRRQQLLSCVFELRRPRFPAAPVFHGGVCVSWRRMSSWRRLCLVAPPVFMEAPVFHGGACVSWRRLCFMEAPVFNYVILPLTCQIAFIAS